VRLLTAPTQTPNASIEGTANSWLRHLLAVAHVKRYAAPLKVFAAGGISQAVPSWRVRGRSQP